MEYVDRSQQFLCFLTEGYFASKNCFRELLRAVAKGKPCIVMLEPEAKRHGGLAYNDLVSGMKEACDLASSTWELDREWASWRVGIDGLPEKLPTCDELLEALSLHPHQLHLGNTFEYDRIPAFLDVTLRMLAERLVQPAQAGSGRAAFRLALRPGRCLQQAYRKAATQLTSPSNRSRASPSARASGSHVEARGVRGSGQLTPYEDERVGCKEMREVSEVIGGTAAQARISRIVHESETELASPRAKRLSPVSKALARRSSRPQSNDPHLSAQRKKASSCHGDSSNVTRWTSTVDFPRESCVEGEESLSYSLDHSSRGGRRATLYMGREIIYRKRMPLPAPRSTCKFHLFYSKYNLGAQQLIAELVDAFDFGEKLMATDDVDHVHLCEQALLLLDSRTWTSGLHSKSLAGEIQKALENGVHMLLVHERESFINMEGRFGTRFESFITCAQGATPVNLLKRGIYKNVACPMMGGAHRKSSLVMLHDTIVNGVRVRSSLNLSFRRSSNSGSLFTTSTTTPSNSEQSPGRRTTLSSTMPWLSRARVSTLERVEVLGRDYMIPPTPLTAVLASLHDTSTEQHGTVRTALPTSSPRDSGHSCHASTLRSETSRSSGTLRWSFDAAQQAFSELPSVPSGLLRNTLRQRFSPQVTEERPTLHVLVNESSEESHSARSIGDSHELQVVPATARGSIPAALGHPSPSYPSPPKGMVIPPVRKPSDMI